MSKPEFEIPRDRLPPGFVDTLGEVPEAPVVARPAATIVLLRQGTSGIEVLLLRRTRSAGFVPGAYVFPGGRVDVDDADPTVVRRFAGLTDAAAAGRLELPDGDPPAIAYYLAAIREAFEETGILVGMDGLKRPAPSAAVDPAIARMQDGLRDHGLAFGRALQEMHLRLDGASVEYIAHWITPIVEPRRYDTRFFAAEVPADSPVRLSPREMNDGVWLTPAHALERQREGTLPMVFPTIKTLQQLVDFRTPRSALDAFRRMRIPAILPRLVRTSTGVGLEMP